MVIDFLHVTWMAVAVLFAGWVWLLRARLASLQAERELCCCAWKSGPKHPCE